MSRIVDNIIAFRILSMLVKPFEDTDAFKLGIIDAEGKNLKPYDSLSSTEKDAFTYLDRLTGNMKKLLNKLPGGENRLKSIVAALFLVKEQCRTNPDTDTINETEFHRLLDCGVILCEETITVRAYFKEDGAIANVSMPASSSSNVSTDIPLKKLKGLKMVRRKPPIPS